MPSKASKGRKLPFRSARHAHRRPKATTKGPSISNASSSSTNASSSAAPGKSAYFIEIERHLVPGLGLVERSIAHLRRSDRNPVKDFIVHLLGYLLQECKQCLKSVETCYARESDPDRAAATVSQGNYLAPIQTSWPRMLTLLKIASQLEQTGQEGELNALNLREYYDFSKGVWGRLNRRKGPDLTEPIALLEVVLHSLGGQVPIEGDGVSLIDLFENLRNAMICRLLPRYVHEYQTFGDALFQLIPDSDSFSATNCEVEKGRDECTDGIVAIKIYSGVVSPWRRDPIMQEIAVMELCHHPNIVRLVEAFTSEDEENSIHIAMVPWAPYTLGKLFTNNRERARRCPWLRPESLNSDQCVVRIMYELANGVAYLHERKIKHKDLKPANILLHNPEDSFTITPVIADVGVSKVQLEGGPTRYVDSTHAYLAIEQIERQASTLESDIWQLGCCFAELLAMARGGRGGWGELQKSYNGLDCCKEECSHIICLHHGNFLNALAAVCLPGNEMQERVFQIVRSMLSPCHSERPEAHEIRDALQQI